MAAIQDAPVQLPPGGRAVRGFFGWIEADHPEATSAADLAWVERALALPEAMRLQAADPGEWRSWAASLFSTAPLLETRDLTAAGIAALFGTRLREVEREDGRPLSFFVGERSHVALKAKELIVLRPHGQILRTGEGAVIQDLDGDGFEGTGWVIFYMHIERRERVEPGTTVKTGDRIGHPSCEGGVSDGTHVHLARKYNGEWIPADQDVPFVLDGWISRGQGNYYDGVLERNGQIIEAWADRDHENIIQR